ncbi:ankyrin [Apiospora sp. TS-2023a]
MINAADCPLCDYSSTLRHRGYTEEDISHLPTEKFSKHLGRHLEQLALFILPNGDLTEEEDESSDHGRDDGNEDSDTEEPADGMQLPPEADLLQNLSDLVAGGNDDPSSFTQAPDLAMRWQPPQDFTPPQEDFDTEDTDLLPLRQEPIYGGDLFTPGWARGIGRDKEGYCARCPVFHWVNMVDGSYRFHLTYFHGVPDSGVPLPRPTEIRPVMDKVGTWEGFCEACSRWRLLKKTKRGWSWYRHWLNVRNLLNASLFCFANHQHPQDHADIVKQRTDAIRNGIILEETPKRPDLDPTQHAADPKPASLQNLQELSVQLSDTDHMPTDLVFEFARTNSPEVVEAFLDRVLRVLPETRTKSAANLTESNGLSLLMLAASLGASSLVELLLSYGADPNQSGPDDQTALDLATDAGYFNIAQKLIETGAEPSKSRVFEKVMSNSREYAGEMTSPSQSNAPGMVRVNIKTLPELSRAAFEGNAQTVRDLLFRGGVTSDGPSSFDVDEGAENGQSAFLLASMEGHLNIMDILLEKGANINTTSNKGWTPLMIAARNGDDEGVMFLLEKGADVNHVSPDRWTALSESTIQGSIHIMSRLLEAGADPEMHAASDWTPLMHAAYRGHLEAVQVLLTAGASFEETSARDETVMLLAAANGSADVVRLLLEAGCPPESVWSRTPVAAVTAKADASVPTISEAGTSKAQERIERVYLVGWTPLMVACQVGSLDVVRLLLDAGANPEPRSPMLKTALEIAKENGRTHVTQYLIERLKAP